MSNQVRVHLAQISAIAAYYDESGMYAEEPAAFDRDAPRLAHLRHYAAVSGLLNMLAEDHREYSIARMKELFDHAAEREADLIVFPEYSVPFGAIEALRLHAARVGVSSVLGTHRVTAASARSGQYENWQVRTPSATAVIGSAMCPIVDAKTGAVVAIPKANRSKWEPTLVEVSCTDRLVTLSSKKAGLYSIGVFICIDGLIGSNQAQIEKVRPNFVVVTALTPSHDEFEGQATRWSADGGGVVFCNTADFGGTFAYVHQGSGVGALGRNSGESVLPARSEAILESDEPLADPLRQRGAINLAGARTFPRQVPLAYDEALNWAKDWGDAVTCALSELDKGDADGARDWLQSFVIEHPDMPDAVKARARVALRLLGNYEGNPEIVSDVLRLKLMKTADFAQWQGDRVQKARAVVRRIEEEVLPVDDDNYSRIADTLRRLARDFPPRTPRPATTPVPVEVLPNDADERLLAGFKGRRDLFDRLEDFFRSDSSAQRALFLTGFRGIGKTSALRVLFPKSLNHLRPVWVEVPSGATFATVLAKAAIEYGVHLDIDMLTGATKRVFLRQVAKVVKAILEDPRPLILDDLGDLAFDGRSINQLDYLIEAIADAETQAIGRLVLVASRIPRRFVDSRPSVRVEHVQHLSQTETKHALRWYLQHYGKVVGTSQPAISSDIARRIGGHPLAIRLLAQAVTGAEAQKIARGDDLPDLPRRIVEDLLPKVSLDSEEQSVITWLSVFREGVEVGRLEAASGLRGIAGAADRCVDKGLVQFDWHGYTLLSLFRNYFVEKVPADVLEKSHAAVARVYESMVAEARASGKYPLGQYAELAFHLVAAGNAERLREISAGVKSEILPVARQLYRRTKGRPVKALKLYELLAQFLPDEPIVHAYVGRCYARLGDMTNCDMAFARAIEVAQTEGQPIGWLYRDWGQILWAKGDSERCLECFARARLNGQDDASMLAAEGEILWKVDEDLEHCIGKFQRARTISPHHSYVLGRYATVLAEQLSAGHQHVLGIDLEVELHSVNEALATVQEDDSFSYVDDVDGAEWLDIFGLDVADYDD